MAGNRVLVPAGRTTVENLQSLVEVGVDKNTTVVFPAPLMSTIGELGAFLARETAAAGAVPADTGTQAAGPAIAAAAPPPAVTLPRNGSPATPTRS